MSLLSLHQSHILYSDPATSTDNERWVTSRLFHIRCRIYLPAYNAIYRASHFQFAHFSSMLIVPNDTNDINDWHLTDWQITVFKYLDLSQFDSPNKSQNQKQTNSSPFIILRHDSNKFFTSSNHVFCEQFSKLRFLLTLSLILTVFLSSFLRWNFKINFFYNNIYLSLSTSDLCFTLLWFRFDSNRFPSI